MSKRKIKRKVKKMEQSAKINLELSLDEINVILDSLSNMPFKAVFNVIQNVQRQAQAQINPPAPVKAVEDNPEERVSEAAEE